MITFTATTKDKCRHCVNEFDAELQKFLISKGVPLAGLWYKLEESKYTKWHAHGLMDEEHKFKVKTDDKFYFYFKPLKWHADPDASVRGWIEYCIKGGKPKSDSPLDAGVPFFHPDP